MYLLTWVPTRITALSIYYWWNKIKKFGPNWVIVDIELMIITAEAIEEDIYEVHWAEAESSSF